MFIKVKKGIMTMSYEMENTNNEIEMIFKELN